MAHRASKLNNLVSPLGYRAVPQPHPTITWHLVALTEQVTKQMYWGLRLPVAADPNTGRWESSWPYQIAELLTEAEQSGVEALVVFAPGLDTSTGASIVPANDAYQLAVAGHRNWLDRNINQLKDRLAQLERDRTWWATEHPRVPRPLGRG